MKIPYEIVSLEVNKMFLKDPEKMSQKEITENCNKISSFLDACGWDEEEFINRMFDIDYN